MPKRRVAFLTYAKGEHGAAAMKAANGCSVSALTDNLQGCPGQAACGHDPGHTEDCGYRGGTSCTALLLARRFKGRQARGEVFGVLTHDVGPPIS